MGQQGWVCITRSVLRYQRSAHVRSCLGLWLADLGFSACPLSLVRISSPPPPPPPSHALVS